MNERTTLEIIAPTVEEALAQGLAQLGLPADAVSVEVLDSGNKGLFGLGGRQVRVRLTVNGPGGEPAVSSSDKKPAAGKNEAPAASRSKAGTGRQARESRTPAAGKSPASTAAPPQDKQKSEAKEAGPARVEAGWPSQISDGHDPVLDKTEVDHLQIALSHGIAGADLGPLW